ncbi:flagellar hook-length control protein FliK [Labrenzia sp. 011]|uniref:flagellar hook-length control protein FliK n=1 Tax=Labrenzia sp. 011 TaxID=2171494 RepID=UPI000D521528|nr:flagellar hook-length control protein FliK [Labrenzia sp. 011]PVB62686.1 hypothetical protein DCO57_05395 [Labrenzia sp. 011]
MTLSTQSFTPSAPQSGSAPEGRAADTGQSAQETAAEFHNLVQGMKKEDATGKGKHAGAQAGEEEGHPEGAQGENGELSEDGEAKAESGVRKPAFVSFTTSNLADSLRQVSQKILSKPAVDGDNAAAPTAGEMGTAGTNPDGSGQGATALPINTVLAIPAGQNRQTVVPASQDQQRQSSASTPVNSGLVPEKDGNGKVGASSLFAQFGVEPEQVTDAASSRSAARSMLPEEAAGTVKVLRQETHFAPNLRLSPIQQVGEQIVAAVKEIPSGAGAIQQGLSAKAEGPVLKTLDIQLTPHELGSVKVSLRMVGDTVEVTLVASKAQTAELLKQDRQLLDQMLRVTGFKADAITVQAADDRPVQQPGASPNGQSASGQNGSAGGDGQAQSFNGGGSDQQNNRPGRNGSGEPLQANDTNAIETTRGAGHENDSDISLSDGIYL